MIKVWPGATEYRDLEPGGVPVEGLGLAIWIEKAEIDRLLAEYNPASSTSPLAGDCRPIVRAILDAIMEVANG